MNTSQRPSCAGPHLQHSAGPARHHNSQGQHRKSWRGAQPLFSPNDSNLQLYGYSSSKFCVQSPPFSNGRPWHASSCCTSAQRQDQDLATQSQHPLVERMFDSNWKLPLAGFDHPTCGRPPVLALGKFDALHKGHQALAAAALQLGGCPVLLSFSGMAAVLGWPARKPLIAPCDRPRVLHLWAQQIFQQQLEREQQRRQRKLKRQVRALSAAATPTQAPSNTPDGNHPGQDVQVAAPDVTPVHQVVIPVRQRYVPFVAVRSLSPEAFVSHIKHDFQAAGVVCGGNYRFGYRAAGDAALLKHLCQQNGLSSAVVELVGAATPGAVGPVSSTKIREMLDSCRIEAVKGCLGRSYRLVAEVNLLDWQQQQLSGFKTNTAQLTDNNAGYTNDGIDSSSSSRSSGSAPLLHPGWILVPFQQLLNQHPAAGVYLCNLQLFIGATAHDDLLQLQQGVDAAAISNSSSSNGGSSSSNIHWLQMPDRSSDCSWCIHGQQLEVEVVPDGLLVPKTVWEAAESCLPAVSSSNSGSSSSNRTSCGDSSRQKVTNSSHAPPGNDPMVWDTDDREDYDNVGLAESSSCSVGQADGGCISALLVLDFEACLMQTCVAA